MSIEIEQDLRNDIIHFLQCFTGLKSISLDAFLSKDLGVTGGDGVQILYELEDRFSVDLHPLVDSVTVRRPLTFVDRLLRRKEGKATADLTVKQLIEYIVDRFPG